MGDLGVQFHTEADTAAEARAIVDAVRYACPADHKKRLVVSMVETLEAIGNIDDLLAVEGIDVFFIGPGDLSQNMGYPPAPPFGQPRPQAVIDKVGFTVDKIRAAGKIAGTLVRSIEGLLKGSPAEGGRRRPPAMV